MTPEELLIEIQAAIFKKASTLKLVEKGYIVGDSGMKITAAGTAFAKSVQESLCGNSDARHDPRLN